MATSKALAKKKPKIAAKASNKPAARKKATTATKAKPKTVKAIKKKASTSKTKTSASQRHKMIEETAYFIAQKHNFMNGRQMEDWLEAEARVNKLLR